MQDRSFYSDPKYPGCASRRRTSIRLRLEFIALPVFSCILTGVMTKTKLAATVILTRGPADNPEVYLARRAPELNFFGGYWVFPIFGVRVKTPFMIGATAIARQEFLL